MCVPGVGEISGLFPTTIGAEKEKYHTWRGMCLKPSFHIVNGGVPCCARLALTAFASGIGASWASRMKTTAVIPCVGVLDVNGFRFRYESGLGD